MSQAPLKRRRGEFSFRPTPTTTLFEGALAKRGIPIRDGQIGNTSDYWVMRHPFVNAFSWGALTGAMVEALLPHGPFLEVGAGGGYWAFELRQAGADVVATDAFDPRHTTGIHYWLRPERMDADLAVRAYPQRTLLLVWPTYDSRWAYDALVAFARAGGQRLVYMGEGRGGCTADDLFHHRLARDWEVLQDIRAPHWVGIHDSCAVYRRKVGGR